VVKRNKWILLLLLASALLFASPAIAAPKVYLDEVPMTFEVPPIIENGRTLVPLRAIFEALGAVVSWDEQTSTVTAVKGDKSVVLQIGSTIAKINGQIKILDVPAKVVNGRTLAPLRFVGEAYGGTVAWNAETETIYLTSTSDITKIGLLKSNPVPIGKPYLTKQGIEITVNQIFTEGGAWAILEEASITNRPATIENKYIIVAYTVKNVSSPKEPAYLSYADFKMIGSSNTIFNPYDNNIALPSSGSLHTMRKFLKHGDEEMGATVYCVPKFEKNTLLIWDPAGGQRIYFAAS